MSETSSQLARRVPESIESPRAKLVYLYLTSYGEATVRDLQETLELSRLALFSILDSLESRNLVYRTETGYACR
jgi:DNA-binding MarR family transcriptional regulator